MAQPREQRSAEREERSCTATRGSVGFHSAPSRCLMRETGPPRRQAESRSRAQSWARPPRSRGGPRAEHVGQRRDDDEHRRSHGCPVLLRLHRGGWLVGAYCARSSSGRVSIVPSWKPSDGELTSGDSSVASGVSSVEGALTSTGRRSSGLARRASSSSGLEKRSQRSAPSAGSSAALPTRRADAPDAASAAWGPVGTRKRMPLRSTTSKSASYFSAAPRCSSSRRGSQSDPPRRGASGGCVRRPTRRPGLGISSQYI